MSTDIDLVKTTETTEYDIQDYLERWRKAIRDNTEVKFPDNDDPYINAIRDSLISQGIDPETVYFTDVGLSDNSLEDNSLLFTIRYDYLPGFDNGADDEDLNVES